MSKFGNKKTLIDGIWFDSKKEANRYIGECLQGNYESGLPLVFLGLVGIFKAERGNGRAY